MYRELFHIKAQPLERMIERVFCERLLRAAAARKNKLRITGESLRFAEHCRNLGGHVDDVLMFLALFAFHVLIGDGPFATFEIEFIPRRQKQHGFSNEREQDDVKGELELPADVALVHDLEKFANLFDCQITSRRTAFPI